MADGSPTTLDKKAVRVFALEDMRFHEAGPRPTQTRVSSGVGACRVGKVRDREDGPRKPVSKRVCRSPLRFSLLSQPLALHSDYMAEKERADNLEVEVLLWKTILEKDEKRYLQR